MSMQPLVTLDQTVLELYDATGCDHFASYGQVRSVSLNKVITTIQPTPHRAVGRLRMFMTTLYSQQY